MATNSRDEIVRFIYEVTGDKDLAASAATMLKAGEAADSTSAEFDKFSKALKDAASQAKLIQAALAQKSGLAELKAQLADAQSGLAKLNTEFDKTDTSNKKVTKAFNDAEKAVASLTTQVNQQQAALAKTEGGLAKAGVDTTNLAAAFQKVNADGNAAATALAALGTAGSKAASGTKDAAAGTKALGEEANKSGNLLTIVADNLGKIVTVAAAAKLALAGIRFGEDAFKEASQVEDQLARVQASAQATKETFEKFGPAIEAAAAAVNVSSTQAAQALSALVQQGESADEALQSLIPTLQLAKIAQIDVAQAAGIVDDALDRFGLSTKEAGEVVDILVTASKGAKDGLVGIAGAMQQIAPLARDAGLTFKDTAAILGNLQQNGIDAASAVRGLRSIFESLQDPASKLRLDLASLGDDSGDFAKAIDTIAGAGSRGRQTLLDLDGASRVLVTFLAQQGVGSIKKFSDGLDNAAGAAQRTVKAINETAGGAFEALTNSIDRAAADLAKPFLSPVREELQKLADEISAFAKTKDFEEIKDDLTALARDAVTALDKLIHGLKWEDLRDGAKDAITGIKDDFHTLAQDADAVVNAIGKITAAITALKNLGDIGTDIGKTIFAGTSEAALDAALAVSKAKDLITGSVSDTTKALQALADKAKALRQGGFSGFAQDANEGAAAITKLGDAAQRAAPKINISSIFQDIVGRVRSFIGIAKEAPGPVEQLTAVLQKVGTTGKPAIDAASDAMVRLGKSQKQLSDQADIAGKDLDKIFASFLNGGAKIEDVRAQFAKYASDLRASVANSDEWQKQTVEDLLDVKAAALGIPEAFKRIGNEKLPAPDVAPTRAAFQEVQKASSDAADALEADSKRSEEAAQQISGALGNALSAQASFFSEFAASSANAVKRFSDVTKEFFNGAHLFSQSALTDSTGIIKFGEAIAAAGQLVEHELDQQRQGVAALAQQYQDFAQNASIASLGAARNLDAMRASLEGDAAAAREGRSAFDLLGAADLSALSSALDAAAAKVEQLKEQAQAAKDALEGIGSSLADQIDELQGNQTDIENRRFKKQLDDIKAQAEAAGQANSEEYNKLVQQAKLLHELKLKQIKEEQDAQKKSQGGPDAPTPTNPTGGGSGGGKGGGATAAPGVGTVNINVNGLLDQKGIDDLSRKVKKVIDEINGRGV